MKAQDLRLGNFVIAKNEIIKIIEFRESFVLGENDNSIIGDLPSQMKPIELTEEWLLKIGFDAMHSSRYMYEKSIINKHNINVVVYITFHTINKTLRMDFSNDLQILNLYDIQYLHQLQNAFYLLTNEELEVKL